MPKTSHSLGLFRG